MAVLSKVWVCAFCLVGVCPARGMDSFTLVSVVCCQVEVSAVSWPLIQCSPTECGVSECDCEATIRGATQNFQEFEYTVQTISTTKHR